MAFSEMIAVGRIRLPSDQPTTSVAAAADDNQAKVGLPDDGEVEPQDQEEVDLSAVSTDESTAYVICSIIRRLDCAVCSTSLGERQAKEGSQGFISEMTNPRSKLIVPNEELLNCVSAHIKPISNFINDNITKRKIISAVYDKFNTNFNIFQWCSAAHKRQFLTFLSRTLIRIMYKVRNATEKDKRSKKYLPKGTPKIRCFIRSRCYVIEFL